MTKESTEYMKTLERKIETIEEKIGLSDKYTVITIVEPIVSTGRKLFNSYEEQEEYIDWRCEQIVRDYFLHDTKCLYIFSEDDVKEHLDGFLCRIKSNRKVYRFAKEYVGTPIVEIKSNYNEELAT